jgi:LPPG:FO 2-phospho-L-lactate transferase
VLAGGVGAARFLRGLSSLLDPQRITVIVNTGDDESFFGLHVSPDVDTITYTLAGRVDAERGWGVTGESFACLGSLGAFYPETWFQLGDRDLATHIHRTDSLHRGEPLSRITRRIAEQLGVKTKILPMSDDRVRTIVHVADRGALHFQEYLVRDGGQGRVDRIRFTGARKARPAPGVLSAIERASLVIIPPSNPIVSIFPILSVGGVRRALQRARAPVAAVSPLVGGRPIKGPLHRMLAGLGHEVSAVGVAKLYRGLVDLFALDASDAHLAPRIAALGMQPLVTDIVMHTPAHSRALAETLLTELAGKEKAPNS